MAALDHIFQLIAEHTTDLICIHDSENTIRFATPSSISILGYRSEDLVGRKLTDFLSEDFINKMDFSTLMRFFDQPGTKIRYQVEHAEKRLRWLETTYTAIGDDPVMGYNILSCTRDVTESVHLMDDLMEALSKEQEISRLKSNLYSVASHEFKTPLAVIQANIEMIKIKRNEKILENALGSIEEEVDRLNSMIMDMLELKKLTSGQTSFRPEMLDAEELTREVLQDNIHKIYTGVSIEITREGNPRQVLADYGLLRFIIGNLVTNACKFSNGKGKVSLIFKYEAECVKICVKDKGIGIPESEHEDIFKSFYRASNAGNIQGTGVGLAIVREFVDLHDGKITLESTPGRGSNFCLVLPGK